MKSGLFGGPILLAQRNDGSHPLGGATNRPVPAASHLILSLASPDELAGEIGHLIIATRTIRGMEAGIWPRPAGRASGRSS